MAPIPTTSGKIVVRINDRPVTVWPFVPGDQSDDSSLISSLPSRTSSSPTSSGNTPCAIPYAMTSTPTTLSYATVPPFALLYWDDMIVGPPERERHLTAH